MDFNTWVAGQGFDPATLTEQQKLTLQAAWRAAIRGDDKPRVIPTTQPAASAVSEPSPFQAGLRAAEIESERIEYIEQRTLAVINDHVGNPAKIKQLRELCESA